MEDAIRLLIVDDEEPFLEALGERLAMRDFAVTTAPEGESPLGLLRRMRRLDRGEPGEES